MHTSSYAASPRQAASPRSYGASPRVGRTSSVGPRTTSVGPRTTSSVVVLEPTSSFAGSSKYYPTEFTEAIERLNTRLNLNVEELQAELGAVKEMLNEERMHRERMEDQVHKAEAQSRKDRDAVIKLGEQLQHEIPDLVALCTDDTERLEKGMKTIQDQIAEHDTKLANHHDAWHELMNLTEGQMSTDETRREIRETNEQLSRSIKEVMVIVQQMDPELRTIDQRIHAAVKTVTHEARLELQTATTTLSRELNMNLSQFKHSQQEITQTFVTESNRKITDIVERESSTSAKLNNMSAFEAELGARVDNATKEVERWTAQARVDSDLMSSTAKYAEERLGAAIKRAEAEVKAKLKQVEWEMERQEKAHSESLAQLGGKEDELNKRFGEITTEEAHMREFKAMREQLPVDMKSIRDEMRGLHDEQKAEQAAVLLIARQSQDQRAVLVDQAIVAVRAQLKEQVEALNESSTDVVVQMAAQHAARHEQQAAELRNAQKEMCQRLAAALQQTIGNMKAESLTADQINDRFALATASNQKMVEAMSEQLETSMQVKLLKAEADSSKFEQRLEELTHAISAHEVQQQNWAHRVQALATSAPPDLDLQSLTPRQRPGAMGVSPQGTLQNFMDEIGS